MLKETLLFLLLIGTAFTPKDDYASYCNSKFSFCIKYPKSFHKSEESTNGDGAFFSSRDKKTEIRAYGRLAIEGLDELSQEFGFASEKITVTYKAMKDDWFVFSGTDSAGAFIYQKTAKKKIDYYGAAGTAVFQTVRLKYPAGQQKNYEEYCKVIAKSF